VLKAVRISEEIINEATIHSQANNRYLASQIAYWAKIGKTAEDNPELNYYQIKDLLLGLEEIRSGNVSEYQFG
jgi:hypothetical protein